MSTAMVPVSAEVSSGRQALEHPEAIEFAHIQRVGNMFVVAVSGGLCSPR